MKVIRRPDFRAMPWKNGGGTTYEILAEPAGVSLDAFDWRISIAHVGEPGPFSMFSGIDRSIAVLAGNGMALQPTGQDQVIVDALSPPWRFPGEWTIDCRLENGPTLDFNVMTRRTRIDHFLKRLDVAEPTHLARSAPMTGICLASGDCLGLTTRTGDAVDFELHDFVLLDAQDGDQVALTPRGKISLLIVELSAVEPAGAPSTLRSTIA